MFNRRRVAFRVSLGILGGWFAVAGVYGQLPPTPASQPVSDSPQPKLFVQERTKNLGKILEGDTVPVSWTLENHGDADLIIEKTRATCGCTIVRLAEEDKIIPPGGKLELMVEFNSTSRPGNQRKNIGVYTNDPSEPKLTLVFTANVEMLFKTKPTALLNLRSVRRGESGGKTLDILPGPGRKSVVVRDVELSNNVALTYEIEPLDIDGAMGQRIRFAVPKTAALGSMVTKATLHLSIDGLERTRTIPVRLEVVGDLSWTPKVLDASRQTLVAGRRLAPVTIRGTDKSPFDVIGVTAGPMLEVVWEQITHPPNRSAFSVYLTIRNGVDPGPFATMLEIRTTSLDQPWIGVPVFGIIKAPVQADPPFILLRNDGTPAGHRRRLKLMTFPSDKLDVSKYACDNPAVTVKMDMEASRQHRHIRILIVELTGEVAKGRHEALLTMTTNIKGAERLEIPVTIDGVQ